MKTSNILLLCMIGIIILTVTGGMIAIRLLTDRNVRIEGARVSMKETRVEAAITMPELSRIQSSGGSIIRFDGFSGNELSIDTSGGSDISGKGNTFRNVQMDLSGTANITYYGKISGERFKKSGFASIQKR